MVGFMGSIHVMSSIDLNSMAAIFISSHFWLTIRIQIGYAHTFSECVALRIKRNKKNNMPIPFTMISHNERTQIIREAYQWYQFVFEHWRWLPHSTHLSGFSFCVSCLPRSHNFFFFRRCPTITRHGKCKEKSE